MYISYLIFVLYNFGPRHRWEVDIKMGLNKIGCWREAWTRLIWLGWGTWRAFVNMIINLQVSTMLEIS